MKYYFSILLAAIVISIQGQSTRFAEFNPEGYRNFINISGETNVHHFNLYQIFEQEKFVNFQAQANEYWKEELVIRVPVKKFHTPNKIFYNDFIELMQGNKHPYILISIPEKELQNLKDANGKINPEIHIKLAGTEKTYRISCRIDQYSNDILFLRGQQKIKLTDFKIEPPVKSFGLIKVNNSVFINFGIIIPN